MNKVKSILLKEFKPIHVLGITFVVFIVYLTVLNLFYNEGWMTILLLIFGTMFAVSISIQLGRFYSNKEKVSPLILLQFMERSIVEIGHTVKVMYFHLKHFKKLILLLLLVYVAEVGGAEWLLTKWGGSLSADNKELVLGSLHVMYKTVVSLATLLGIAAVVWNFMRIAFLNHFSKSEELVSSIFIGLREEGIEASYTHSFNGRCHLDTDQLLNTLVNGSINTSARSDLYWLIKNNINLLQQTEFYPCGKPKTPIQQLKEYLQKEQTLEQ